jgi:glutamate synthase domain-containing protein 2
MIWLFCVLCISIWILYDAVFEKEEQLIRNYPVIARILKISSNAGVYLRKYILDNDLEGKPFSRKVTSWIEKSSRNEKQLASFGTILDHNKQDTILFIPSVFPTEYNSEHKDYNDLHRNFKGKWIGEGYCKNPYFAKSAINMGSMPFGSFSTKALVALSEGAKLANIWLNTGEGSLTDYHTKGGCDIVLQLGPAKIGFLNEKGEFDLEKFRAITSLPEVKMVEIKLSQGAKPGYTGTFPGAKVTSIVSRTLGVEKGKDLYCSNKHKEIYCVEDLLNFVYQLRSIAGKPVGIKLAMPALSFWDEYFTLINKFGLDKAPDFISIDGSDGGTGEAAYSLLDATGLPISVALPDLVAKLHMHKLRDRIKIIASGKLVTASSIAWALSTGADFTVTTRGFMLSMGCVQSMKCHTNSCPTGITSEKWRYTRGFDPQLKKYRILYYIKNLIYELELIAQTCGINDLSEFIPEHYQIIKNKR